MAPRMTMAGMRDGVGIQVLHPRVLAQISELEQSIEGAGE
jgi:hypothetical protein